MFNLNHFYYFYTVAEAGSVTAASKALHISQPALSKQLKIFETSLNTKLFEKQGRGLQLTPIGFSLFGKARGIFEKAKHLSREFTPTPNLLREQIRIGLGTSIERSFAAEVVGEFFKASSSSELQKYSVSVVTHDGSHANRYLREHVIDACIAERRLFGADIFEAATILNPICLVAPAKFAPRLRRTNREDLRASVEAINLPWIVPSTNIRLRNDVESILENNRIELRPILESDSMLTIVRSVENGVGLALIPKQYCKAARDPKRLIILDKLKSMPRLTLSLWVRRAEKDSIFVKMLAKAFKRATQR